MVAMIDASAARQIEDETAPSPRLALHADVATVRLYDVPYDRETEAGGADRHPIALHVPLEDAVALVARNAGARVGDDDPHDPFHGRRIDGYPAAARGVPERVRDEIRKRPGELRRVSRQRRAVRRSRGREGDAALRRLQGEDLRQAREHAAQVDRPALDRERHGAPPRYLEQPLRDVLEAFHVAPDRGRELPGSAARRTDRPAEEVDAHS